MDPSVPRVDLGLGDDVASRLARSAAAYRGRDRAVELVQGNPAQALGALRRAVRRGGTSLALMGVILGAHGLAHSNFAIDVYVQARCGVGYPAFTCRTSKYEAYQATGGHPLEKP